MKPSDALKAHLNVYTGDDAETIDELQNSCGLGATTLRRFAADMVECGKWEKVMVKRKRQIVSAYIVKEK